VKVGSIWLPEYELPLEDESRLEDVFTFLQDAHAQI
jgi:hypothetical protein